MKIISKLKEIFKTKNNAKLPSTPSLKKTIEEETNTISLEDLTSLDCEELLNVISKLPQNEKTNLLKNDIIKTKLKKYILEKCSTNIVQYINYFKTKLTVVEILSLLDVQSITETFDNDYYTKYKLFEMLSYTKEEANQTINYLLNNKDLFLEYMKLIHAFNYRLLNLNHSIYIKIINKLYEYNAEDYLYYFVNYLPINEQKKIIDEKLPEDILLKLCKYIKPEIINYLFKIDNRMDYLFDKIDPAHLINEDIILSSNILYNPKFLDMIKKESFIDFRNNINLIEKHNLPEPIERNLKLYYQELIDSYDLKNGLFKQYLEIIESNQNCEHLFKNRTYIIDRNCENIYKNYKKDKDINILESYQKLSNFKLSEIIVDALFQDNIYNVFLNIKEMIRYNYKLPLNDQILDEKKIDFYNLILNIDHISPDEKIKLYNKLKDKNINLMFYEDLRTLKDKSYKIINDQIFKIDNQNPNSKLSKKYKVPIYDMRNQEFFMLVRSEDTHQSTTDTKRNCYSIISSDNSITFGAGILTIYGYNVLDIGKVLHIYEKDAFSADLDEKTSGQKYAVNRIMTPEEIVNSSAWYSEIQIINSKSSENEGIYLAKNPDFIVAYEEPSYSDIKESKRLNIPIVIINKQHLENDKQIKIDKKSDKEDIIYVNNRSDEVSAEYKLRK